jgi:sporulation protein YlmC with PRC-barrel domain
LVTKKPDSQNNENKATSIQPNPETISEGLRIPEIKPKHYEPHDRTLVSTQELIGMTVFTADERKLGKVVNLILNKMTYDTSLVVFPAVGPRWLMNRLGGVFGKVTGSLIGLLNKIFPGEVDELVLDQMSSRIEGRISTKGSKILEEKSRLYYLIPAASSKEFRKSSIHLSITRDECKEWHRNVIPPAETEMPILEEPYYKRRIKLIPELKNLTTLRDHIFGDEDGRQAIVKDIFMDIISGQAIVMEALDPVSEMKSRFIRTEYLKFEGRAITFPKRLEAYPSSFVKVSLIDLKTLNEPIMVQRR